ncbi:hypothetical protein [Mucilaginibacter terrenus]|nr:hypothetical protein [Mucilaginibacter terrenus]
MTTIIAKLKTDLYRVFVKGDANTTQLAHIFLLLAVPAATLYFGLGSLPL